LTKLNLSAFEWFQIFSTLRISTLKSDMISFLSLQLEVTPGRTAQRTKIAKTTFVLYP
jgi:hypothetical protein